MCKVLNFFGGPGAGKTTVASGVFFHLKTMEYNVEFVQEIAKQFIFENRLDILSNDQLFVLANQNRELLLKYSQQDIDFIVMESPILLSNIYFNELSVYNENLFKEFTLDLFNKYDNINFYVERNNKKFNSQGRIHNEYESKLLDLNILKYLNDNNITFHRVNYDDNFVNTVLNVILSSEQI